MHEIMTILDFAADVASFDDSQVQDHHVKPLTSVMHVPSESKADR